MNGPLTHPTPSLLFVVTFVGDHASLTTTVDIPPSDDFDEDDYLDAAEAAARDLISDYHGIDVAASELDTIEVSVQPAD